MLRFPPNRRPNFRRHMRTGGLTVYIIAGQRLVGGPGCPGFVKSQTAGDPAGATP